MGHPAGGSDDDVGLGGRIRRTGNQYRDPARIGGKQMVYEVAAPSGTVDRLIVGLHDLPESGTYGPSETARRLHEAAGETTATTLLARPGAAIDGAVSDGPPSSKTETPILAAAVDRLKSRYGAEEVLIVGFGGNGVHVGSQVPSDRLVIVNGPDEAARDDAWDRIRESLKASEPLSKGPCQCISGCRDTLKRSASAALRINCPLRNNVVHNPLVKSRTTKPRPASDGQKPSFEEDSSCVGRCWLLIHWHGRRPHAPTPNDVRCAPVYVPRDSPFICQI